MKNITMIFSAALILVATTAFAQLPEPPKSGAKIFIEDSKLAVAANGETTFDMYIVRSKKAGRTTFDTPQFVGAEGVSFEVAQDASNPDKYTVTARGVEAGSFIYTVKSRSNSGTQTISGTTVSVSVGGGALASGNNE